MQNRNHPNDFNMSLIQQNEQRQLMLGKMRGKLASQPQFTIPAKEKRVVASNDKAFGWGYRIALLATFLLGNFYFVSSGPDTAVKAAARKAPRLAAPMASLSVNEQAMYWALALYDFDQLRSRYGVPPATIVNAGTARKRLEDALVGADAATRFQIDRMRPPERNRK